MYISYLQIIKKWMQCHRLRTGTMVPWFTSLIRCSACKLGSWVSCILGIPPNNTPFTWSWMMLNGIFLALVYVQGVMFVWFRVISCVWDSYWSFGMIFVQRSHPRFAVCLFDGTLDINSSCQTSVEPRWFNYRATEYLAQHGWRKLLGEVWRCRSHFF